MSTRILYVCIKYCMCDLICDVINCCVRSCDTGKMNEYDKVVIEKKEKKRKHVNQRYLYIYLHLKDGL